MYEHHKKHRLRRRGLSPLLLQHTKQNTIQATGSVTTDSLRLQHTCVCAATDQWPVSWVFCLRRRYVRACTCMYVCLRAKNRHAAKSEQHPLPQYTSLHASATHICVKSHTLEHHNKSSRCNQATVRVTTGSLLLRVLRLRKHCSRVLCVGRAHVREMTCAQAL